MSVAQSNAEQTHIHPTAIVHPAARVGSGASVGAYCVVGEHVTLGDGVNLISHVVVEGRTRIGNDSTIYPFSSVGHRPQDLKYHGEPSELIIGERCTIRENCTLNPGTAGGGMRTEVGDDCLFMASTHVAHDCKVGDHVIMANNVNLAGHVEIEDWAILEGLVAVQQFIRIGKHSFVAGGSLVRKNVPPYIKAAREPLSYAGINAIGLTRRQFSPETINHIHDIYRILFVKGYNLSRAIQEVEELIEPTPEREDILGFIKVAEAGVVKGYQSLNGSGVYED